MALQVGFDQLAGGLAVFAAALFAIGLANWVRGRADLPALGRDREQLRNWVTAVVAGAVRSPVDLLDRAADQPGWQGGSRALFGAAALFSAPAAVAASVQVAPQVGAWAPIAALAGMFAAFALILAMYAQGASLELLAEAYRKAEDPVARDMVRLVARSTDRGGGGTELVGLALNAAWIGVVGVGYWAAGLRGLGALGVTYGILVGVAVIAGVAVTLYRSPLRAPLGLVHPVLYPVWLFWLGLTLAR